MLLRHNTPLSWPRWARDLGPAGPDFRQQQDVHGLADQLVAEPALELLVADVPVVRLAVVRSRDDGADVTIATFTEHVAVIV